jgi:hypothetical protein
MRVFQYKLRFSSVALLWDEGADPCDLSLVH